MVTSRMVDCLLRLDRPREALEELEHLWNLVPSTKDDRLMLEQAYDALGQLGRWAEQDATARALCEVSANPWFFYHTLRAEQRGPYEEALARYRRLDELLQDNDSFQLRLTRAVLAHQLRLDADRTSDALCEELLRRDPGNADVLQLKAEIALGWSHHAEALEFAERTLRVSPTNSYAQLVRAQALCRLERHAESLRQVEHVLATAPALADSTPALYVQALCLDELGREAELRKVCARMQRSPRTFLRQRAEEYLAKLEQD